MGVGAGLRPAPATTLGYRRTPQARAQRFAPAAAPFLYDLLPATMQVVVAAAAVPLSLLRRFSAVVVIDGCVIPLPPPCKPAGPAVAIVPAPRRPSRCWFSVIYSPAP